MAEPSVGLTARLQPSVDDRQLDRETGRVESAFQRVSDITPSIDVGRLRSDFLKAIPGSGFLDRYFDFGGGDAPDRGGGGQSAEYGGLALQKQTVDILEDIRDSFEKFAATGGGSGGGGDGGVIETIGKTAVATRLLSMGGGGAGGSAIGGLAGRIGGALRGTRVGGAAGKLAGAARNSRFGGALGKLGSVGRRVPVLGAALYGAEGLSNLGNDRGLSRTLGGAVGGLGGAAAGAKAGAMAGGAIGSVVPGAGTAVGAGAGALIGGVAGGLGGDKIGREIGEAAYDTIKNFEWPTLPSIPDLGLPSLSDIPKLKLPSLSDIPKLNLPALSAIPKLKVPTIDDLPRLQPPSLNQLPKLEIDVPQPLRRLLGMDGAQSGADTPTNSATSDAPELTLETGPIQIDPDLESLRSDIVDEFDSRIDERISELEAQITNGTGLQ